VVGGPRFSFALAVEQGCRPSWFGASRWLRAGRAGIAAFFAPLRGLILALRARTFSRLASRLGTVRLPDLVGICSSPLQAVLSDFLPIGGAPFSDELLALPGVFVRHKTSCQRLPLSQFRGIVATPTADGERLFLTPMLPRLIRTDSFIEPCIPTRAATAESELSPLNRL
jgi:hypothetical protein